MDITVIKIIVFLSSFISLAALLLGVFRLLKKDMPGFFILTLCSVASCFLQDIHTSIGYLFGDTSTGLTICTVAIFGCFMFFIAASIGPIDKLQDKISAKTRLIAMIAPIVMAGLLIFCSVVMFPSVDITTFILNLVFYLPSIFASYFVLKHILLNDVTGIYKAIRGCNIVILINILLNMLYLVFSVISVPVMLLIVYMLRSISTVALVIESIRGYKKWKTLL